MRCFFADSEVPRILERECSLLNACSNSVTRCFFEGSEASRSLERERSLFNACSSSIVRRCLSDNEVSRLLEREYSLFNVFSNSIMRRCFSDSESFRLVICCLCFLFPCNSSLTSANSRSRSSNLVFSSRFSVGRFSVCEYIVKTVAIASAVVTITLMVFIRFDQLAVSLFMINYLRAY